MNKFYIGHGGQICINEDTDKIVNIGSAPERISRIFMLDEPTEIIYSVGETERTLNAEKGDIVIVFYEKNYKYPVITVKSEEWLENITGYLKKQQAEKEAWAAKQCESCNTKCMDCDCADC